MRRNNKGLTLIELVVTVAIIAIFSGVVLTFISTGANSYRKTSNNAEVQMETQQALDQIEDLVIGANRSIYYASGSLDSIGSNEIKSDIDQDWADGASQKHFVVCNAKEATDTKGDYIWDIITWDSTTKELTYRSKSKSYEKKPSTDQNDTTPASQAFALFDEGDSQDQLSETEGEGISQDNDTTEILVGDEQDIVLPTVLAHDITSFRADVTKVESEGIVRFQLITNKKGKEIKTIHTINLRNKIKVQAPNLNLEDLPTENAKIYITNAKDLSSDCGSYIFTKSMIGDILPNTVVWSVEGTGCSFPTEDKTSGKMTVDSALPTRTVTVKVTAQTASGNSASDEKTITITKKRTATGLTPTTDTLILGVGNQYDLNDLVKEWKIVYSDGTQGEQVDVVQWSGSIGSNTIGSDGSISIPTDIGTDMGNSSFTIFAHNNGVSGSVTVNIARLDILQPANIFHVGDKKPFEYQYREGGQLITGYTPTITIDKSPNGQSQYIDGDRFVENDIGDWKIKAEVQLGNPVYGSVTDVSEFSVAAVEPHAEIYLLEDAYAVVPGTYTCAKDGQWNDFSFVKNWSDDTCLSTIRWSIEGKTSSDTTIENIESSKANLVIGTDERGFILRAEYTQYNNRVENPDEIVRKVTAEREVSVVSQMKIISLPPILEREKEYDLEVQLVISNIVNNSGTHYNTVVNSKNGYGTELYWEGIHQISYDNTKVNVLQQAGDKCTVKATLGKMPDVHYSGQSSKLTASLNVEVVEEAVNGKIIVVDDKTTILEGETTDLWVQLRDHDGKDITGSVTWEIEGVGGTITQTQTSTGSSGKVTFQSDTAGDYIIKAKYTTEKGTEEELTQQIIVSELNMLLEYTKDEYYFNSTPGLFTAHIYSENENSATDVTDQYDIQWILSPSNEDIYMITSKSNNTAEFKVIGKVNDFTQVKVTANALKNNKVVASVYKNVNVNIKNTETRNYNCSAGNYVILGLDDQYSNEAVQRISAYAMKLTDTSLIQVNDLDKIPTLTLTQNDRSITMNSDPDEFREYKYILLSFEYETVIYNHYIYPVINNVYNSSGVAFAYAPPGDEESIKKMSILGEDGYTYLFTDKSEQNPAECEIRLSIDSRTGVGTRVKGNSSLGKWFMKREDMYYKYQNDGWYEFGNQKNNGQGEVRYRNLGNYWNLKEQFILKTENGIVPYNTRFWQQWN